MITSELRAQPRVRTENMKSFEFPTQMRLSHTRILQLDGHHQFLFNHAKTDEALKAKESMKEAKTKEEEQMSLAEQVRRIKDIEAIESDSFVPQAFKSSRDGTKVTDLSEIKKEAIKEEDALLPTSIMYNDSNALAHPNLFMDKEEAESVWLNRLISLRQERLMGSPVS
ncbi:serine/Arginine-related protein 53-like [Sinocyclocheilus rhinocerous]|uniref:serine/Arginine-related protein 53-like n=1 Tax=Sinocyclocheilus rhinocerous TaxID=307959 RepID=UPI0007B9EEA2|nr:PREDICTED: serine/Arginine-related protein 53-like [Sinocyclocheilus rhinocerous]